MVAPVWFRPYEYVWDREYLPGNVYFLGPKSPQQGNGILKGALFLVHAYLPEGYCGNLIQSWFHARPTIVLTFDLEGIIQSQQLGYVSGLLDQMVADVRRSVNHEGLRSAIGARAREIAIQRFDTGKNACALEQFITKTCRIRREAQARPGGCSDRVACAAGVCGDDRTDGLGT